MQSKQLLVHIIHLTQMAEQGAANYCNFIMKFGLLLNLLPRTYIGTGMQNTRVLLSFHLHQQTL